MPQLDINIFMYQNINFLISFFSLFFIVHYYIFPSLLKNIYLRRSIINRKINLKSSLSFSFLLLKKYNETLFDNFFFNYVNISTLKNLFFFNLNISFSLFKEFIFLKISFFEYFIINFYYKLVSLIWINLK